jgi:hypothetical protein
LGHNLAQLGSAALDTFGGLISFASPQSLPEGASPRNFDVDFTVGGVGIRPGLVSIYSYATTIQITSYSLSSGGLATFGYIGTEPTINEGFVLSGFTGTLSVLNGQQVFVETVNMTTFSAFVTDGPFGTFTNLSASGVSTTGQFIGPNVGSIFNGPTWVSPNNISSATDYASTSTGLPVVSGPQAPTTVTQETGPEGPGNSWSNPSNIVATGASYATVGLTFSTPLSQALLATGLNASVPSNATVTGISVSYVGFCNTPDQTGIEVCLTINGTIVGTVQVQSITETPKVYTEGSPTFLWGTSFTPANVNGQLGVLLFAACNPVLNEIVSANSLQVTVYYTQNTVSGPLLDEGFSFATSTTNGISGFLTTFKAYSNTNTSATLQLLQDGVPVGTSKTVQLTTSPEIYLLGGPSDLWGATWTAANVNSVTFGVQVTAEGAGITNAGDLDITVYITPALANFNWIGSYEQNNLDLFTLALDADGNIWKEDVINNPDVLSLSLSGIIPGSYANGATFDNSEFIMFSDLTIGTDRPRQLDSNGNWYPVTQVGPGVPPTFQTSTGSISGTLQLISYTFVPGSIPNTGIVTLTYTAVATAPVVGSIYVIGLTGTFLDRQAVIVLTGSTTTTFSAEVTTPGTVPASGTFPIGAIATPSFSYSVVTIVETPPYAGLELPALVELSASATNAAAGSTVTIWYQDDHTGGPDENLLKAFNSPYGAYVYISGTTGSQIPCDGVWQVIAMGLAVPPGESDGHWYFSFTFTSAGAARFNSSTVDYRQTSAILTVNPPILGLSAGTIITLTGITGTPQSGWNNSWPIIEAINTGQYTITTTQYASGLATYGWEFASLTNSNPPVAGQLIEVTGATNNAGFNGTFSINSVSGSTFTVVMTLDIPNEPAPVVEGSAQAVMSGTQFLIDPGATYVGTDTDVIYGNVTGQGQFFIVGTTLVPIGAGTRQAIVFFITESGNWTPASPPVTFTVPADANLINLSNIPIGPPNVVGRGIAITEAGANGVPGANFYVITEPVISTVNTVTTTYSSTIINDNITQSASFSFTDAVLLNSQEVDISGFNLFNLIELGSSAWCVPYSSRMFYGMQLNKVQNFDNLTFDGGYVNVNQPAGWSFDSTASTNQLIASPVTGDALYISNTSGAVQPLWGLIYQTAYQDAFNVPIIASNTAYSVRIACACPSGIQLGTLVVDLTSFNNGNFGTTYGSFSVPFTSMGSLVTVFTGPLITTSAFPGIVTPFLQFRVYVANMGLNADVLIDRIEVFPTEFPYLKTEVYGSYINKPESVDASGDGGIIDTSTENAQTCFGGFVMRDQLYLLKTSSMYSTRDNPNSEPGGWSLTEVSNRVGAIGINAYDVGEEWAVMACRNGIFGFDGGKPQLINLETLQIWECINFNAGNSICLRNDTENRRILCAVPLPTGTSPAGVPTATVQWLPYAPYNPAPTTPNVMLVLNYQAIGEFSELMAAIGTHATMFGSLANPDMRRKWTIWQIPTPYMGMVTRANYIDTPLYICNGIESSKIYDLDPLQYSDDGAAIYGLYTTYGHVNAVKAATIPIFGLHTKRYTILQFNAQGAGNMTVRMIPNDLGARYPYSIPGGVNLVSPTNDDWFRPINVKGQRLFLEFSTNAAGSWWSLDKTIITGKQDAWSSLNSTGGGNAGIV